jgi:hypothetical protein
VDSMEVVMAVTAGIVAFNRATLDWLWHLQ